MNPDQNILSKIPFLRFSGALAIGIIVGEKAHYSKRLTILLFATILFLVIASSVFNQIKKFRRNTSAYFFSVMLILMGMFYSLLFFHYRFPKPAPEHATYIGVVQDKSPSKNNRYKYTLKLTAYHDSIIHSHTEDILLYSSDSVTNSELKPGNQIQFTGKLYKITTSNNPGEFDYKRFINLQGIRYQTFVNSGISITDKSTLQLKTTALNIREKLLEKYKKAGIIDNEFAVVAALTLGDKSFINPDLKKSFSASGATHVLAVSGLHVGIIYMILKILFKRLGKSKSSRIVRIIIIVSFLWFYALITGLSPSVLRSCTMFSLIVIGENLNRKTNIYNTLCVSAFVLMLFNPAIIFSVGFQLSYAAVTSIVYFQPKIATIIKPRFKVGKWTWELFAVSLAAQIGTFPISIFYFHQFPVYFWISNFIVIPAATLLLYSAILFFVFSNITIVTTGIALLINAITKAMNIGVQAIEKLPCSVLSNIWIDQLTMLAIFAIIILLTLSFSKQKPRIFNMALIVIIATVLNSIYTNINIQEQQTIVIYNNYKEPLISLIDGTSHFYYSPNDSISFRSEQILENASGYFHTQSATSISETQALNRPQLLHNHILFNNLSIRIHDSKNSKKQWNLPVDISWNTQNSEVLAKKTEFLKAYILKNSKVEKCTSSTNTKPIKTLNNSALILKKQ